MSLEGTQFGHYKLLMMIGSGSMGEVYLAEDVRISRQVALKVVKAESYFSSDQEPLKEAHRGLHREMRAIANLSHIHILPIYDFGTEIINQSELTYIVMPYFSEGSLKQWVQQRSSSEPLSSQSVAHFISQAAEALQHAHDNNIIHQDIKPVNFLIRTRKDMPDRPDIFLADFGIAKFTSATLTTGLNVRGTPGYMPPEQWESDPVPATDQYALAIMAYELLTKRLPFQGRMEQVMHQHYTDQPAAPSTLNPQITNAMDAVILRALAKQPEERFPCISDFAHAFQQATTYTDLRTTLILTRQEAMIGINRNMKLPGLRQTTIAVPPRTFSGQILRIDGEGEPYYDNGPRGPLVLTVAIDDKFKPTISLAPHSDLPNQQLQIAEQTRLLQPPITPPYIPAYLPVTPNPPMNEGKSSFIGGIHSLKIPFSNWKGATGKILLLIIIILLIVASSILGIVSYQNALHQQTGAITVTAIKHTIVTVTNHPTTINNPYPHYLPGQGVITVVDPLSTHSQWSADTNNTTRKDCIYRGGTFQVSEPTQQHFSICNSDATNYSNFAFEVQMMIIKGDCGGITFRYNPQRQFYLFKVCQSPSSSDAALINYRNPNGTSLLVLVQDRLVRLKRLNQWNTLTILAKGSELELYINNQLVGIGKDGSYPTGAIGLLAYNVTNSTEVAYKDAKIWTLK